MTPVKHQIDCDDRVDDTVVFYSRIFGEDRIVVIPKEFFTSMVETETTYILTFKRN